MNREEYWAQEQPELKIIHCCCGYGVAADKLGIAILRKHQELCQKFTGE